MSDFSLDNPPLICVAARVQFAPVTKIDDYITALQEEFRLRGYPLFASESAKAWRIQPIPHSEPSISCQELTRWSFANGQNTVIARVDQESITLFFGDYRHFSDARSHYQEVFEVIEKVVPALQVVGWQLRYINHIPLEEGESAAHWVQPLILGLPNLDGLTREGSISETGFQTESGGNLVVRCASLANGLSLPADLLPLDLTIKHSLHCKYSFVMLELVHSNTTETSPFAAADCLEKISSLRPQIVGIFRGIVTPEALNTWT